MIYRNCEHGPSQAVAVRARLPWAASSLGILTGAAGILAFTLHRAKASRRRRQAIIDASVALSRAFGSAQIRPNHLHAWLGPALLITNHEACAGDDNVSGFYFRQARFLRELKFELFGECPHPCSAMQTSANTLEFTFIYPEKKGGGSDRGGEQKGIRYRDLDLRLTYEVQPNGVLATVRMVNRWMTQISVDVRWRIGADFADIDEVEGERKQNADSEVTSVRGGIRFRYMHPQLPFETHVIAENGGIWSYSDGALSARFDIERQAERVIQLRITAIDAEDPIDECGMLARKGHLRQYEQKLTAVHAPGTSPLAEIATRSKRDLASLTQLDGPTDEWLAPIAGIPLFHSFWGRDALTAAWQATVFDRGEMAEAVLNRIGRLQGARDDPWRDEQPGRTLRVNQRGPLTRLNITPFGRYYGDYAGPFAYIFALGQLYAWSGDKNLLRKHWDNARRISVWARKYADIDGDGYLEYETRSEAGPTHQGWRDAENAVVYEDGAQVKAPIAPCEVQGYWYAAEQLMAVLAAVLGEPGTAVAHWDAAQELKKRFNRDFWMDTENCVALGLDPEKRQIRSVTSNAGQALATGIVNDEHLPRLVRRLFASDIFSGWGIRTLSSQNPAYNPLSYHLGSVWPVENATLLFGLRRFGFDTEALTLARAMYDLALVWKDQRIPECVGGYDRNDASHPGAYPRANVPQTWNQSVFPILVQALLGIMPVAPLELMTVDPILPAWAPELILRNLRVGDAKITLHFWRKANGDSRYEILEKEGALHVVRQPPLTSLSIGIWDRLGVFAKDFISV
jgi:glycogen debranching enzyme